MRAYLEGLGRGVRAAMKQLQQDKGSDYIVCHVAVVTCGEMGVET